MEKMWTLLLELPWCLVIKCKMIQNTSCDVKRRLALLSPLVYTRELPFHFLKAWFHGLTFIMDKEMVKDVCMSI